LVLSGLSNDYYSLLYCRKEMDEWSLLVIAVGETKKSRRERMDRSGQDSGGSDYVSFLLCLDGHCGGLWRNVGYCGVLCHLDCVVFVECSHV
jgi:hypothetical protein